MSILPCYKIKKIVLTIFFLSFTIDGPYDPLWSLNSLEPKKNENLHRRQRGSLHGWELALNTETESGVLLKRGGLGDNFGNGVKQAVLDSVSIWEFSAASYSIITVAISFWGVDTGRNFSFCVVNLMEDGMISFLFLSFHLVIYKFEPVW